MSEGLRLYLFLLNLHKPDTVIINPHKIKKKNGLLVRFGMRAVFPTIYVLGLC